MVGNELRAFATPKDPKISLRQLIRGVRHSGKVLSLIISLSNVKQ